MTQPTRVLTIIVCGAGPASEVGQLIKLAQERGWTVQVVATPAALDHRILDVAASMAKRLNAKLHAIHAYLPATFATAAVGGMPSMMGLSAEALAALLPSYPFARSVRVEKNVGYGHGILTGLQSACGELLAWSHADLQTDPADVFRAFQLYQRDGHAVARLVKGRRKGRGLAQEADSAVWLANLRQTRHQRAFQNGRD